MKKRNLSIKKLFSKQSNAGKNSEKRTGFLKKYLPEILVFIFFVLIRLPNLGHDNFNTDVWRWKARSYDFGNGISTGNFGLTLQKYHPGVTLMWLGSAGAKITSYVAQIKGQSLVADENISIVFQLDKIQKILLVIMLGIATSFLFHALRNLFGLKYSALSVLLLSLEPFYLGLTRMFHLEGMVSTFMSVSIVWLYYYFQDTEKRKRLILSGVFAGFSLLTKTSAFFLVLFTGLITILYFFRKEKFSIGGVKDIKTFWLLLKKVTKGFIKVFLPWIISVVIVFCVLWPAMWVIPLEALKTLYLGVTDIGVEGDHFQFYFGNYVEDPGPSFYFVVFGLRSSIYLIIGFFGALMVRKKVSEKIRNFMDFLLIFVFFYFIQLTVPTKKLDRYILPVFSAMSLISTMFFVWVLDKIKFKKFWKKVLSLIVFLIPAFFYNAYVHPDYLSYFNPMFGGLKTGVKVLEPKWLIGTEEILEYFSKIMNDQGMIFSSNASFEEIVYRKFGKELRYTMTVGFKEKYYTQIWPFFREFGAWAVIKELKPFADKTKYFVYPVWDDTAMNESDLKLRYFDTIKLRGVPLYNVYFHEMGGIHVK